MTVHSEAFPRHHVGGQKAVLLLHGWKGFPGLMYPVYDALADQGFTVDLPRLPGHGTTMTDMLRTGGRDWLRRAMDAYADLAARHETVYVVGHSMGGVISLILAAGANIERVALLAPAVKARSKLLPFSPLFRPFIRRLRGGWREEKEENPQFIELGREYWRYHYSHTAAELYRLQRICRRELSAVTGRILTIVSENDQLVPPEVAELIKQRAAGAEHKLIRLTETDHNLPCGREQERVVQAVVDWLT